MDSVAVLIVGPAGRKTGGVARYIAEQTAHLPDSVRADVYDNDVPEDAGAEKYLHALADILKFPFRRRPDVVHVHTSHWFSFLQSAFYVFVAAFLWRRPVVLHVHGSSFDEFVERAPAPLRWLQFAVFDACDAVVVLSDYWKDVVAPVTDPDRVVALPNAVDLEDFTAGYDAEVPHLIFLSNHVERKGVREFVEAVETLEEEAGGEFRVTIAGSGPLSDRAERLAERYENVEYAGYVSEEEKRDLLAEGSIYVLPTYAEGLPIAVLEAMAGGNAVVSTTVGSIPGVVDEGVGITVEPKDVDALTDALRELLDDPERVEEMGREARRRVEAEYSWDAVMERLLELYERVAHGRPLDET